MITHSSDFTTVMEQPEKTIRVLAYSIGTDDQVIDPTQIWYEDLKSVSVDAIGAFLGASSRSVTANVYQDQSSLIGVNIRLDLQVLKPDDTWETIELGYFSIDQVEYDIANTMSKVTLYDGMMQLSTTSYSLTDDQFPMTVQELATIVADIADVTLDTNFSSLPNANYSISENLWKTIQNTHYRDIVREIAEATGTTAVVSGTKLLFKQYGDPADTLIEENLIKFKLGRKWGNVNSVSLSRMPQNDNILLRNDADVETNGLYEVTIVNNQIVDDDRTTLITPLYDALVDEAPYINFYDSEFTTEGHGWHEVGDLMTATLSGVDYPIFITEHHLLIDGGIQETLKSVIPTNTGVNKTTAGGILKSLWNTEIKVDKQNNEIVSLVSRQDDFETTTEQTFTQIVQDVNSITTTLQDGGGMNLIQNSVGYSVDDGLINFWTTTTLTADSRTDTSAFPFGAISGSTIDLTGVAGTFTQRVIVNPGGSYVISFLAKKQTQGVVTVSATNDLDSFSVTFDDDTEYEWAKYRINDITPTSNYLDITFTTDADVDLFSFTDLVMVRGIADKGWTQAVGEVANTNVILDTTGITVKSNVYDGAFTRITPIEFAGYDNQGNQAFALNNDTTEVNQLDIGGNIETTTHSIVFLTSGPNAGMNFVVKG